ncbi:hypothetical protein CRUP_025332 [Coryphaenoides rupestris]|nr:hypothetical protein CRUP_025332 [Coryphaenoides rupestris]
MIMKTIAFLSVLCGVVWLSVAKESPPKVQIYTKQPAHYGEANILVCHLTGFQPPEISFEMMEDGVKMPGGNVSELIFEDQWQYHLTGSVPFTPKKAVKYTCSVKHMGKPAKVFEWDLSKDE